MRKLTPIFWTTFLSLAFIWSLGCNSNNERTLTPTESPKDLLSASATQMGALDSLAFTLTHEKGSTPLMTGIVMNEMEGAVDLPDKFSVDIKAEATVFSAFIEIKVIGIENTYHMTDPISGNWREISPGVLPFNFANLGRTLGGILTSIQGPMEEARESIGGQRTVHIKGTVTSRDLAALIPNAANNIEVGMEVWIQERDAFLIRARIEGPVVSTDPPDVVRILNFTNFNEPVTVEPPI